MQLRLIYMHEVEDSVSSTSRIRSRYVPCKTLNISDIKFLEPIILTFTLHRSFSLVSIRINITGSK